ncbi:L-lactate MFS transporter [Teredinibacter haidensis]|uniref:L-lactate MFS transporter n=1 Tax=Teredinibacter haidensis TaxID=2731755 RepID=UPI00163C5D4C|nr:OFA family MFS transporter [Teredinibacter haidensis]
MKNRWLIALSGVGIHVSIGSVYSWSVFNLPLASTYSWENTWAGQTFGESSAIAMTFSLAIFFLGTSAAIMGHFVERRGPRASGTLAAMFFGCGMILAGIGTWVSNIYLLWLGYGVLGGIGLGIGYITPVSTLVKWFPDRRGLATGLAIMGFGFGASIASVSFNSIIENISIPAAFMIMGGVYLAVMLASATYLERPPQGWMPDGMKEAISSGKKTITADLSQQTANEAVKTGPFYGLWIMMFINISCGIGVIYSASPLAQESIGLSAAEAAAVVGAMALFNGLGRIGWASFSDFLGRGNTYMAFFILQIVLFWALPNITSVILFQIVLYTILTCYGGGFATLPAFIGDLFGTKELGAIHGYVLTAWALAGIVGPQLNAALREMTGSYETTLYIFAGAFIVALTVSLMMKAYIVRATQRNAAAENSDAAMPEQA